MTIKNEPSSLSRYSRYVRYLPFVSGVAVGVLLSIPFAAPMLGTVIEDPAATLWGAALGSGIAVMGALWVANESERTRQANAARVVEALYSDVVTKLDTLTRVYDKSGNKQAKPETLSVDEWKKVKDLARDLIKHIQELDKHRTRIDAVLPLLSAESIEALVKMEQEVSKMFASVQKYLTEWSEPANVLYASQANREQREKLGDHNRRIGNLFRVLKKNKR